MHPQITELLIDYRNASARLDALAVRIPDERWGARPDPERWSLSENVEHLNIMSEAFLPELRRGIDAAKSLGGSAPARYRRDPLGWFMWKMMPPPVRMRVSTPTTFVPVDRQPQEIRDRFAKYQAEFVSLTTAADGLPLDRVKVVSPVSDRARYNLFAALGIVPRHQHRHLWQAEQTYSAQ